jgi:hypothetical protein
MTNHAPYLGRDRSNMHTLTEPLLKLNNSINEREQRIVAPSANIISSVIRAATLTNQDVSSANNLTTKLLNSETLTLAVSTVPGTSYRFLMCH